jgi:cell division septum initiation protein DivIVA
MPRDKILEIKPIDIVKDDIEVLKYEIHRLQDEVKKINIKLKAKESIQNDNVNQKSSGWWW